MYYFLIILILLFIFSYINYNKEQFSNSIIKNQCKKIKQKNNNIKKYKNNNCNLTFDKTINEKLNCRYLDEMNIFFNFNENSWCNDNNNNNDFTEHKINPEIDYKYFNIETPKNI